MANMWMVRAGPNSFLIDDFLNKNIVAIGWDLGDLSDKTDNEIRELYRKKYKNLNSASQILRFKNQIEIGDYVLAVNGRTRTYFIGKITSDYYRSEVISQTDAHGDNYFDVRDVEWFGEVQRDSLKKNTRSAVGTSMTVFEVNEAAKKDILKVFNQTIDTIDNSSCIIRSYLNENNLTDFPQDDAENAYAKFKNLFGPEVLEKLEGTDIINKMFTHDGDKSNLCYNLEYAKEFNFGGIGGGSAFKFSLFKSNSTHKWTSGSPQKQKVLTESEAVEVGSKIRDALVDGAKHIEKAKLESVSDYIKLENDLFDIFKECIVKPTSSWVHKYYVLIFPDKFPEVHSDAMKKDTLRKFRIKPERGYYANDAQLYLLAKKSGITLNSLFDEKIIRLFFECDDIWAPIEKGKLVKLTDCVKKPRKFNEKRNLIYFGAPGTGKSYNLNQDKDKLLSDFPENYERVTFHPDYSYANFVGTYKPVPEGSDITYKYVPGPFMRILKKAINNPSEPFLLIIEEINRANVAAVFGDVFQLLDRDENNESVYPIDASEDMKTYLNEDKIILPKNLFIWATMNSADQGVFPMDTAFKRRWDFKYFSINNNENLIEDTHVKLNGISISWNTLRKQINDELLSYNINEDKLMGPFFAFTEFMNQEVPEETFKDIFKNKIIMYLFEDAARSRRNQLFRGACNIKDTKNITYFELCELIERDNITEIFSNNFLNDEEDDNE